LVFHYTGIDVTVLDNDTAAKYMAMNRRAMLALGLAKEQTQQANVVNNNA